MKRLLSILLALLWATCMTPAARAQNLLRAKPQTNSVSSLANSNFIPVEIPSLGTNSTQLISVSNLLESLKVLPNWTGGGSGVETNAVLTNIVATGAMTNKWNSWQIYGSPTVSNSMFAVNRGLGIVTNSTSFSGLLQSIANMRQDGAHILLMPNPYMSNSYSCDATVYITNGWLTLEGYGNPGSVIRGTAALNGPVIEVGATTALIGGIVRFKGVRIELDNAGANSVGYKIVDCAEPVWEECEVTGYGRAGIELASTNYMHWGYMKTVWCVSKRAGAYGLLVSAGPLASVQHLNHFEVYDCQFGTFGGGEAILVDADFPNFRVINSTFKRSSGTQNYGIAHNNGRDAVYSGNKFVGYGSVSPILFANSIYGVGTNLAPKFYNNTSDGTTELITLGANVTNVAMSGNTIAGGGAAVLYEDIASNGRINNLDPTELRLGYLPTNSIPYIDAYGVVRTASFSGLSLSAGVLSASTLSNALRTDITNIQGTTNLVQARQGGNAHLTNLTGVAASTVTNENSSALQINTGTLTLTPGALSNLVASGHGAPYIAVNTNSGSLASITNLVFRSGAVVSNDSAGIASIHIAASSSGGTNFANWNVSFSATNLAPVSGREYQLYSQTNASHGVNIALTVPPSGQLVRYAVSNSSASAITVTLYTNNVAANMYDERSGTNVNTFTAAAASVTDVLFDYKLPGVWFIRDAEGLQYNQLYGTGVYADTNGVSGLDLTISTLISTNYANAATNDIDCSRPIQAAFTNDLSGAQLIRLLTPRIGTWGNVYLRDSGSARTIGVAVPAGVGSELLSTNWTSNSTNILTVASKLAVFSYEVTRGTNGTTNVSWFVTSKTP